MFKADQQATQGEGRARIRRVVIEERQRKTLEHVRLSTGYAEDLDPHAHDQSTFRLINQRKELDSLRGAATVVPALDDWKYWTKMNDWDSRNRLLEQLTDKMRRREASQAEIQLLVVLCHPAWQAVMLSLRRYGGLDLDPGAAGVHQREEARRVNELDRAELDQVVQNALMDVLRDCPRPFPRRFFPWVKNVLAHRALDHVHGEITEGRQHLPYDDGIQYVLDELLTGEGRGAGFFAAPASPAHAIWLRTLDLPRVFELAHEYATYARTRTACERAVERLPDRQRQVIQQRYFESMTQEQIASVSGIAASSVRNTHRGALTNLRRDDALFDVLEAVGKVRDAARRQQLALERERQAA
jgi:RNA polymerase sigma factor (sigma-70 family)